MHPLRPGLKLGNGPSPERAIDSPLKQPRGVGAVQRGKSGSRSEPELRRLGDRLGGM